MKYFFSDPELSFNQIVFEHRNKEYGAYDLRTESNRILAKSLFLSLAVIAGISLTAVVVSPKKAVIVDDIPIIHEFTPIPDFPEAPVKPDVVKLIVKTPPPAAQNVKTFDNREITPTRNVDDSKLTQKVPDDAIAGTKNNFDAKPAPVDFKLPINTDQGSGKTQGDDKPVKNNGSEIIDGNSLSVGADFIGGIDAFRNKVLNRFDTSDFVDEGLISTTITFIVERDGTISGIKADGKNTDFNQEAIRTVMNIKGKWSPGKDKSGNAVRSYFKFPIKMKFDQ